MASDRLIFSGAHLVSMFQSIPANYQVYIVCELSQVTWCIHVNVNPRLLTLTVSLYNLAQASDQLVHSNIMPFKSLKNRCVCVYIYIYNYIYIYIYSNRTQEVQ